LEPDVGLINVSWLGLCSRLQAKFAVRKNRAAQLEELDRAIKANLEKKYVHILDLGLILTISRTFPSPPPPPPPPTPPLGGRPPSHTIHIHVGGHALFSNDGWLSLADWSCNLESDASPVKHESLCMT